MIDVTFLTNEDKEELEQKIAQGGGGGGGVTSWNDLTDKPFGTELGEKTMEYMEPQSELVLDGFPLFAVGDTVTVKVDGVEHSFVAWDENDCPTIGDTNDELDNGTGTFGWKFYSAFDPATGHDEAVLFWSMEPHTVSWSVETIKTIEGKYLPKGVPYAGDAEVPFNFTFNGDTTGKEVIEVYEGVGYVKVADIVLTRDDLTNAVMTMMSADEEIIYEFDLESIIDVNGDGSIFGGGEYVLAVQRDSEMSGLAFAPGLYFINYPGVYLVKSLIKEGATVTEEVINKLDSRCLPTDATELYLTSPGGEKFKITVSDDGVLSASGVTE